MNAEGNPILEKEVQLERFHGKGGWTYARLPEIPLDRNKPFGWRKVSGFIDDFEIKQTHLMPMGNGVLFLPVNAAIRKAIKKQEGDWVKVILFEDRSSLHISVEFMQCLEDEPEALTNFKKLAEAEQKKYITWISAPTTEEAQIERMAQAIKQIALGKSSTKFSS